MTSTKNTDSPRIVMLLGSMPPMPVGGAEIQAVKLCKALNEIGIETKIITWGKLWHRKKGVYSGTSFIRLRGIWNAVIDIPSLFRKKSRSSGSTKIVYDDKTEITNQMTGKVWSGMILRYRLFYIDCLRYLRPRKDKFDIIHVHMMEWPAIVAVKLAKKLGKGVVIKDSTMNGIFNLLRYPDGQKEQQEIVKHAYCVAMTNMIHSNYLKAGVPPHRIADIPNGIEVEPQPARLRPWSNSVIFVGNLTQQPAKGIDILLYAWKKVLQVVNDAKLEIVGAGDIDSYKKFCKEEGIGNSVIFSGKQEKVSERLAMSDVFVLPSRREGMSNALMEAMMRGMPIVASRVSGSEDLIENNLSGLLVPVADSDRLAEGIIYMLRNRKHALQMGKNAYQSVVEKCNIEKVARQYSWLYHKILKGV